MFQIKLIEVTQKVVRQQLQLTYISMYILEILQDRIVSLWLSNYQALVKHSMNKKSYQMTDLLEHFNCPSPTFRVKNKVKAT